MCNVGLMLFMCYRHPTSAESILKYPNVFCGTEEHALWLWNILQALESLVFVAKQDRFTTFFVFSASKKHRVTSGSF